MLRDEAIEELLSHLDDDEVATFRIRVDNGEYQAGYATGVWPVEGERSPILTDALVSLAKALRV